MSDNKSTRVCVLLKPDGSHEEVEYEYTDDWQERVLGGKMLEVGDIPCLNVMVAIIDPESEKPSSAKPNMYEMPDPQPPKVDELRANGKLLGDIILYNGDGDFVLDKWVLYKDHPENFDDEDEDDDEEEDDSESDGAAGGQVEDSGSEDESDDEESDGEAGGGGGGGDSEEEEEEEEDDDDDEPDVEAGAGDDDEDDANDEDAPPSKKPKTS